MPCLGKFAFQYNYNSTKHVFNYREKTRIV